LYQGNCKSIEIAKEIFDIVNIESIANKEVIEIRGEVVLPLSNFSAAREYNSEIMSIAQLRPLCLETEEFFQLDFYVYIIRHIRYGTKNRKGGIFMNISTNEIKDLGLMKIYEHYFGTDEVIDISCVLSECFLLFSTFKLPAYSFLAYWNDVTAKLDDADIGGMKEFVRAINPLIEVDNDVSKDVKCSFRNSWNSLWTRFGKLLYRPLSSSDLAIISEVGLKLPLFLAANAQCNEVAIKLTRDIRVTTEQEDKIYVVASFYNTVLRWVTVCDRLNILMESEIWDDLTLKDNKAFCEKYSGVHVVSLTEDFPAVVLPEAPVRFELIAEQNDTFTIYDRVSKDWEIQERDSIQQYLNQGVRILGILRNSQTDFTFTTEYFI